MSKGLEAITRPVVIELKDGKQYNTYKMEDVDIIEQELKEKEKTDKVLKFIKENSLRVNWLWVFLCIKNKRSYEYYRKGCAAIKETAYVDIEAYDLLSEVLCNEQAQS